MPGSRFVARLEATPPPLAVRPIAAAALTVAVVLTVVSNRYGFDRDELYFSMLHPAWGYVDQPPFVPLLAHLVGGHDPWLLRLPATAFATASVVVTTLLARELGGDARAQAWTAWGYAGTTAVLDFGHVLLTSTADLLVWPLILLLVTRAVLRDRPRLWVGAGLVAGVSTYNKLLVAWLLAGILLGLLVGGPRRLLRSPYLWGGGVLAVVVGLPNLLYQVANGWPQLEMGRALSADNAGNVRWFMWVFLIVVLGPPLVPVWVAGAVALWRSPLRFLVVAFVLVVALTFVSGAQPHYPTFALPLLYAAGVVTWVDRLSRGWVWPGLFALNAAVAAVISLPLLPVGLLGSTPVPSINLLAADSVGWPAYAATIGTVADSAPPGSVVIASNYGEAGAVRRYRPALAVYSGQNALWDRARPPDSATSAVVVGGQLSSVATFFASCSVRAHLDNGVGVDNEEQGEPVALCTGLKDSWARVWPQLRHLD